MSQEGGGPQTTKGAWLAVVLIVVASVLLGLGMVLQSWAVVIAGAVTGVVGLVVALKVRIMDQVH